jgi:cellulose synthase/poly-beta-1,6-N-acetylglucosamine synthase-like glycosyltransferase
MVCFCFASVAYLQQKRDKPVFKPIGSDYPPVAILYMCCNDLDPDALLSLAMLEYPGELKVIVHDDSQNPQENARVDCICEEIKRRSGRPVLVLRRPTHEGGKPGAVQYVLEQTHHLYDFFLLADSDSYVKSPDVLTQAVSRFDRSEIAIVQCRNRTRQIEKDGPFAKALAWSIDIFDVFMRGVFSYFWSPFVGHNAVLRASAVMKVGGMRPGFFADDIDLSVRLQNQGYVIRYCPDLEISETHPRNYRAFCMRTYKWAMGCVQVLREHTRCVLRSKGFSLLQKIGFFLFCGFYVFQAAVFIYFITICLVMPFVFPHLPLEFIAPLFIGALFPMTVFAPASVYLWKHHRERFWSILIACAGAYGSTDFHVIRGLLRGLVGQSRWIPTNCIDSQGLTIFTWVPYILGLLMLVVPLWQAPWILLVPTTVLFISKFLFIPAIARYYRETPIKTAFCTHGKSIALASSGLLGILIVVLVFAFGFNNPISSTTTKGLMTIEIRGDRFIVNGEEFEIRGIHYSPWRPGSGPHHGNLPTDEEIEQDLELIVRANANTILTFDPSARLLELADRYGLKVIYALHIDWWQIEQGKLSELVQRVEATVRKHKDAPALFAWMLGNEVPEGLINQIGENAIRDAIKTLSNHVRSIDPRHPITHGNWPMTRNLDLEASLDFVSFNLYPYYPPEVAAAGFGQYIEQELKPIAKGRPLLISEFGINTLETTPERQAEILYRCWKELRQVGAAGGIVFEFADEWWKNYDNPVRPPNWWFRKPDPNDHLKHDEDPEEHYGIVTSSRELKPAYEAVRKMFAETAPSAKDGWPGVLSLIAFALVIFVVSMSIYVYRQRSRQD